MDRLKIATLNLTQGKTMETIDDLLATAWLAFEEISDDPEYNSEIMFKSYKKAEELGSPNGKAGLAICYAKGYGVASDTDRSLTLNHDAASMGQVDSILTLVRSGQYDHDQLEKLSMLLVASEYNNYKNMLEDEILEEIDGLSQELINAAEERKESFLANLMASNYCLLALN